MYITIVFKQPPREVAGANLGRSTIQGKIMLAVINNLSFINHCETQRHFWWPLHEPPGRNEVCGIRDQKGGIWDDSHGISDHRPSDRDQQYF